MRALFLDVDGVLNSTQEVIYHNRLAKKVWWRRARRFIHDVLYRVIGYRPWLLSHFTDHEEFCPIAMSNLQYLLEHVPDLKIVVSSTWRLHGLTFMKRVLKKNGIDPNRVIGITPRGAGHAGIGAGRGLRGEQIQEWLDNHQDYGIEDFVIVDDDSDMGHLIDRLVQTDNNSGLLWGHVVEIMGKFHLDVT